MRSLLTAILSSLLLTAAIVAQDEPAAKSAPEKPKPDVANGKYGTLERNTFDLWTPKTKKPSPLVVYTCMVCLPSVISYLPLSGTPTTVGVRGFGP